MFLQTFKHLFWREKRKSKRLELTILFEIHLSFIPKSCRYFSLSRNKLKALHLLLLCFALFFFPKVFLFSKEKKIRISI